MASYFNHQLCSTVRDPFTKKLYRITVRYGVPYITYQRKTRVLFARDWGLGAYVNIYDTSVYLNPAGL